MITKEARMAVTAPVQDAQVSREFQDALRGAREQLELALAEAQVHGQESGDTTVYNLIDEALSSVEDAQRELTARTR
jgi:hypothetical protein